MTKPEALAQLRAYRYRIIECERDANFDYRRAMWDRWHEAVRNYWEAA